MFETTSVENTFQVFFFHFMNGVGGYMRACCAILTNLLLIYPHVQATPAVVDHIGRGAFDWFYMTQQQ